MSGSDESGQTVTLPETDWESITAVLQEAALRERRHNHAETADEIKRLPIQSTSRHGVRRP